MMYSVGGGARNRHLPYSTARLSHENTPGVYAGTPVLQRLTTLQHAVSHGLSPLVLPNVPDLVADRANSACRQTTRTSKWRSFPGCRLRAQGQGLLRLTWVVEIRRTGMCMAVQHPEDTERTMYTSHEYAIMAPSVCIMASTYE
jgi:hypothetical protein